MTNAFAWHDKLIDRIAAETEINEYRPRTMILVAAGLETAKKHPLPLKYTVLYNTAVEAFVSLHGEGWLDWASTEQGRRDAEEEAAKEAFENDQISEAAYRAAVRAAS